MQPCYKRKLYPSALLMSMEIERATWETQLISQRQSVGWVELSSEKVAIRKSLLPVRGAVIAPTACFS